MTGPEDMVEARICYLERTDQVVSVERSPTVLGRWCVQALLPLYDIERDGSLSRGKEWGWRDFAYFNSLRAVAEFLRPQQPVILLEELW